MTVKVALAGATGNLGAPILDALLEAGYHVIVLTRTGSTSTAKLSQGPNLRVAEVDYSSVTALTDALQGISVVVSTLASAHLGQQNSLIDAAVAAGVRRFIPSEFGSDTYNAKAAQLPALGYKTAVTRYLKAATERNPTFTYTAVVNGPFLDWCLGVGLFFNATAHTATVFNGGDVPFSATNLATVAQAVVGVIEHQAETANRPVYVQDALLTQNKLTQYAKEKDGQEWTFTSKTTKAAREEALEEMKKGPDANMQLAFLGQIYSAMFEEGYGQDFSGRLDNQLLGIKGLSDHEVKALVHSFM